MILRIPARPRAGAASLVALAALSGRALAAGPAPAAAPPSATLKPAVAKAPASPNKGLEWVATYEDALARAKKEKKLVLVDFYTDWCGWCKRLQSDVFTQDSFIQAADGVLGVKVNAEQHPQLAQKYQVNSYPRLFFLNSDGVTIERIKGYLSLADFTDKVRAVKGGDTEYTRMRDAATDPTNLPAIIRFAQYLTESGQYEQALPFWQQVLDLSLQQLYQNPSAPGPMSFHKQALLELGHGYASIGVDDAARQNFEELLRIYPDDMLFASAALVGLAEIEAKKPAGAAKARQYVDRVLRDYQGTPAVADAMRLQQALGPATTTVSAKPQ